MSIILISLAPVFAIIIFIYWKDKLDKEPKKILFISFLMGILSVIVTLIISYIINGFSFDFSTGNKYQSLASCILGIGLVEEFSKFLFVRYYCFKKEAFNEPFDGITYAVMVSMGFAALENILYVSENGIGVGIIRMFTAVPAHAIFAIIMGYFLGIQKLNNKKYYGFIGLGIASVIHGLYDFYLFNAKFNLFFLLYWLILFSVSIYLSVKAIKIHQSHKL
jgi:RsiW-degrading membrane proteinase PrsW (M82 family)